jgi:aryl-alcohol dehydrogenase-like predicted oxidoreductase
MQTTTLGRTGLRVSVAGLGCGGHSRLGTATGNDEAHAARVVSHALDLGINFIDTARAYRTETAVGKAVAGRRDQVVISTKASAGRGEVLLSPAELTASLEKSLARLSTDYVDVFHLHGVRPAQYDHCVDVLVPELRRQRDLGKLRFLGVTEQFVGDTGHEMLQRAVRDDHFDVVMVGFNLLNPSARERVFPHTLEHDVGTLIMFAVRRALSRPDALQALVNDLVARGEVDARHLHGGGGPLDFLREHANVLSVVEAAYRFCRHEPGAHVVLTGTGNPEHLTQNVAAIQAPPLPEDVTSALRRLFGGVDSVSGN